MRYLFAVLSALLACLFFAGSASAQSTGPDLSANQQEMVFGPVEYSDNDTEQQVLSVENVGDSTLEISNISITGPHADRFSVVSSEDCQVRQPGQQCAIVIEYTPNEAGEHNAELVIESNDPTSPEVVTLTGHSFFSHIVVSPRSHNYGNQQVNSPSPTQTFLVMNAGFWEATMKQSVLVGEDPGDFQITQDSCNNTILTPGGICQVRVRFSPITAGLQTATLRIESDDVFFPVRNVALSGRGVAGSAQLTPHPVDFGDVDLGDQASKAATLTNTGDGVLAVDDVAVVGSEFSIESSVCPASLPPSASCQITLGFEPSSRGASQGELTVTTDDPSIPTVSADLEGVGVAGQISVLTPLPDDTLTFPLTGLNQPSSRTLVIQNTGNAPLNLDEQIQGAEASRFSVLSSDCFALSLAPGATCSISLQYASSQAGVGEASLQLGASQAYVEEVLVDMSASAEALSASLTPQTMNFGAVQVGEETEATFTLTNTSQLPLSVTSVSSPGSAFQVDSECPATLTSAAQCDVRVSFRPTANEQFASVLSVQTEAGGLSSDLTGVGFTPAPTPPTPDCSAVDVRVKSAGARAISVSANRQADVQAARFILVWSKKGQTKRDLLQQLNFNVSAQSEKFKLSIPQRVRHKKRAKLVVKTEARPEGCALQPTQVHKLSLKLHR